MRIGVVGRVWLPIPPKDYGGSETVIYNLVEGLVDRGHTVTLYAAGGSKTRAELRSVLDKPLYEILGKFDFCNVSYELLNASRAFAESDEFNVLHNMSGFELLPFLPFAKCPVVTNSHSSIKEFEGLVAHFNKANFVSISNAQRQLHPDVNYIATVYHGIDTKRFMLSDAPRKFLLFLSRIMPEKGVELAIKAAKQAGEPLVIAGNVDDRDTDYFSTSIKPHIDDRHITFVGPVNEKQKIKLYQQAKALLFPTQWHEAFGLVMIEALACGTPVIGWNGGAVPEVISDQRTGFIVKSVGEMVQAIRSISKISQRTCREEAQKRFSRPVMAESYERVYQSLAT